ncbi:MAG TPA: efflux RND transporter periplasmic adaptor subunit [Candidatus Dormibacteraeota bacterium]|nr:efflux RND transporter periplasmic adaptor subunit [Candidatus Dormibacteraeota bacterium]
MLALFWAPLLATALLFSGCQKSAANNAANPGMQAMPVQVQVAQSQRIPDATEYLAILKSRHSATINPQVDGQITKIFVKSGDHVSAGTPLLQIDPLKQQATVSSQEASRVAQQANVRYAQTQLERERKLYEAGVVSKQEFDNAQTNYDAAVAQLQSLSEQVNQQQVQLRYYRVPAPMAGIVGDIPVRVGDRVTVTTLLTTVDEPGALEAYIYVPADRGKDLKSGLPVHLLDNERNAIGDTRISFVSPQVDTETQTVLAKASVQNPKGQFRVAQQVRAQVVWSTHEGPVIPILSVSRINGQVFAFVAVNEGKGSVARQRRLKVSDTVGNNYAVLEGLKPGDHIIVSGTQFLQDGMPVAELIQNTNSNAPSSGSSAPAN